MKTISYSNFRDEVIDDALFKAQKKSIGETPESRADGILQLKKKLKSEDLQSRLDDAFLLRFLRVAKFDVSKAFHRVCKYYNVKRKYPNIFEKFHPSAAKSLVGEQSFLASPCRSEDHSAVVIRKRGWYDPSKISFEEMFLHDCLILDYLLENPVTQVSGATVIIDFAGYGFQQFLEDSPGRMKMAIEVFQNSFPLRFKSIHIINAPQIFSVLYTVCSPFLTKKIKNRIQFHSSNDSLLSAIPKEILPEEYGGTIPDSDIIDLTEEVVNHTKISKE